MVASSNVIPASCALPTSPTCKHCDWEEDYELLFHICHLCGETFCDVCATACMVGGRGVQPRKRLDLQHDDGRLPCPDCCAIEDPRYLGLTTEEAIQRWTQITDEEQPQEKSIPDSQSGCAWCGNKSAVVVGVCDKCRAPLCSDCHEDSLHKPTGSVFCPLVCQ